MGQNLRVAMASDNVHNTLGRMYKAFASVFDSETRGTFFNDTRAFETRDHFEYKNKTTHTALPAHLHTLFRRYWGQSTPALVLLQSSIQRFSMSFSKHSTSPGDSMVIVGTLEQWQACRITDIIVIPSGKGIVGEPYLIVEPYTALSSKDVKHDRYRQYPLAGRLFYDQIGDPVIVKANKILCHFAVTPIRVNEIDSQCLHVHPLYRVSI